MVAKPVFSSLPHHLQVIGLPASWTSNPQAVQRALEAFRQEFTPDIAGIAATITVNGCALLVLSPTT